MRTRSLYWRFWTGTQVSERCGWRLRQRKDPALKDDAERVTLAIAQLGGEIDAQELLKLISQKPVQLEIVKAEYGSGDQWVDVTSVLQKQEQDLPLIVLPSTSYNSSFGGDPTPGVRKQLKIQYRMDGQTGQVVLAETRRFCCPNHNAARQVRGANRYPSRRCCAVPPIVESWAQAGPAVGTRVARMYASLPISVRNCEAYGIGFARFVGPLT